MTLIQLLFTYKETSVVRMQTNDPSFDDQKQCTYYSLLIPLSNVYCM